MKSTKTVNHKDLESQERPTKTPQSSKTAEKSPSPSGEKDIQSKVVAKLREQWLAEKISAEIVLRIVETQLLLNPNMGEGIQKKVQQLKELARASAQKLDMLKEYE